MTGKEIVDAFWGKTGKRECDGGYDDMLIAAIDAALAAEREALREAARKVVEALVDAKHTLEWTKGKEPEWERGSIALIDAALADPVIVALGRE
jgi:hypothetical protein